MPRDTKAPAKEPEPYGPGSVARSTVFIPAEYLPNLKRYKYSGSDFSIVSRYVLTPYWNYVVSLVPMNVAPNLITFTGFVVGMSATLILLYFYYFENAVYPAWAWYYTAFSLFAYQTLDAIDGKQARRTGAGSPLGELFDHGCDAFLTPFVSINTALAVNMPPWMTYLYMTQSSIGLFTAIWEQFSTGTFDLGYLSGPTEGILLICFIFILSGRYTTAVLDTPVAGPYIYTVQPNAVTRLVSPKPITVRLESARSFLLVGFLLPWGFTVATNVLHAAFRPTVHRSRAIPFMAALPILVVAVMNAAIVFAFPAAHERYPFVFEMSLGLLVSFTVTKLTIARLCIMRYNPVNFYYVYTFLVYAGILVAKYTSLLQLPAETLDRYVGTAMVSLTLLGIWQYGRMIVTVFGQIAAYLNINIMSIKPKAAQ